jgi:heptosyltransferase II
VKILVRAANWIGDAVMSLPALRALRGRFPDATIHVLAKPWVAALYEHERAIEGIIVLAGAPGLHDLREKWRVVDRLRRERYDAAVLLPNSFESAALVWLAGITERIGYGRDGRSPLLTLAPEAPRAGEIPRHERYYYLELLRRAEVIHELPDVPEIRFDGIEEARERGRDLLRAQGLAGPVVGVSPGAAYGGAKRWLPERFAEAAVALARRLSLEVAVFGSEAERELCQSVATQAHGKNFAGRVPLREFMDMTAACRLFLTNDSGAMHIASALDVATVTVFGPTDEYATGPTGDKAAIVRAPVECAPCLLRECPIDHRCMTRISVERVIEAVPNFPQA